MIRITYAIVAALALSACATSSHNIKPVANAGPCTSADRARLAALSAEQDKAARSDTIGVILVGLPVGSMGGHNNKAEIARLKGRCRA